MGKCTRCGLPCAWDGLCPKCQKADHDYHVAMSGGAQYEDYFTRLKKQQEQQKRQQRPESYSIRYSANGYFKKKWYRNGDLYSGYMQDGYRHGKGKWTRAEDKYTYDGDWYMSKRNGYGEEEMPGKWRFSGEFYDNKRNGFGKLVCADGEFYEGGWQENKKHGKGKWIRAGDKYTYDGGWYQGKRQGHGEEEMPGKWRFSGEFYGGKRNGFGKYVSTDGFTYEGEWQEDKKQGYGKEAFASGDRYEGEFFEGKHCGKGTYYNAAKDETYEGEFRDGKLNGYAVVRYADGRIYEGFFVDNSKTGNGKEIAPDGTVTLGHWEGGSFVVDSVLRGADAANFVKEQPEPPTPLQLSDTPLSEPVEKEFDVSPESFADFMKSGIATESKPKEEVTPAVELMPDFQKRFLYFGQALYGIDRNGVLHISSKMKKNKEVIEAYNGRSDVEQLTGYGAENIIILGRDGKVIFADSMWKKGLLSSKAIKEALPEIQNWSGLSAVACGSGHFVGLRTDGTVIGAGNKICHLDELTAWTGIKAIACGFSGTVGLREDGTVASCGFQKDIANELASWTDITSIACGENHVVGLRRNGTAVACGKNSNGQCDVGKLSNVGMISASMQCTALVLNDGTVKACGKYNGAGLLDPDIVAAACFSLGAIITLDKRGFLHGDMSGIDMSDFRKDFEW